MKAKCAALFALLAFPSVLFSDSVSPLTDKVIVIDAGHGVIRDIASVEPGYKDREVITRVDGREAVEIEVYKEADANIVEMADAVRSKLADKVQPRLEREYGAVIEVASDRSRFIESSIAEVRDTAVIGGLLAVLVLFLFLHDLRSTLIVGLSIPVSILVTFAPLSLAGVSLNIMSLGGLALGVGMLVDNSIVVLESIHRCREEGDDLLAATLRGTHEVGAAVISSTLTTVAVFFPMSFVEGVAGQLVRDLSYAVSFSILSSMAVSLTLVPVLQSLGDAEGPVDGEVGRPRSVVAWLVGGVFALLVWPVALVLRGVGILLGGLAWPFTWAYDRLERTYGPLLRVALRLRWIVLVGAVVTCVLCLRLSEGRGRALLPEVAQGELYVQVRLPQGASLPRTTATMQACSRALADDPNVELRFARIGSLTQAGSASGSLVATHQIGRAHV